ncbi:MAG TPA: cation:proton antiporter [Candidatus Fournierella merdipullorum]|uniref:Cation:proton antiporter n=1 Tax=Candidatus Allofournierella merdipullorum TaxID=2838595 RepID=A0A9D2E6P9_9FIRM|nr:cation:proton antiporter [Candidatus Fournierella merdipullorum]
MLTSLAFVFLAGLAAAAICQQLHLPRIIGMLAVGVVLGPCALNVLDDSILSISADLRQMALIIILLKAGLSLNLADLKKVGRPAVMMSFVPASFEIAAYVLLAPVLLGLSLAEAAVMGAVMAAVSPAVVVPRMVRLMEEGWGTKQGIPQMVMAGASCDDIFVIVLFSAFLGMAQGRGGADLAAFASIPVSIVCGVALGAAAGWVLSAFFETAYAHAHMMRNSMKVIVVLGVSFLLMAVEDWLEGTLPVSGLLAVVSMACVLKLRCAPGVSMRLSQKFGKLWLAAEVILFVLVGAAVDVRYTLGAGLGVIAMIALALVFRAVGVTLCLAGTALSRKERLFCVIAYLPKATVQAAIGSVPLAAGLACGQLVLSVAVVGILLTAPLGALGMDLTYQKLLQGPQKK